MKPMRVSGVCYSFALIGSDIARVSNPCRVVTKGGDRRVVARNYLVITMHSFTSSKRTYTQCTTAGKRKMSAVVLQCE